MMSSEDLNNDISNSQIERSNKIRNELMVAPPHYWVTVIIGCGKVFFLDNNMYSDCYECLQEDARLFTDAQCGDGYGFEVQFCF